MQRLRHLQNRRELNLDKAFYFTDAAYSDMRELVCNERPVVFILHYFYGLPIPYHLLMDRFFFALNDHGELETCANGLNDFFLHAAICRPIEADLRSANLATIMAAHCSETSACIVPTVKLVADESLVTAVLVEGSGDQLLVSSLRGDDFYLRRGESFTSLGDRLALQDGRLKLMQISIPEDLTAPRAADRFWEQQKQFGKKATIAASHNLRLATTSSDQKFGAEALLGFLELQKTQVEQFRRQVAEGFHNVLLAKILWPMSFCYLPYVIAIRRIAELERRDDIEYKLALKIAEQSGLVANIGHLFARAPTDSAAARFFSALHSLVDCYGELEKLTARERS